MHKLIAISYLLLLICTCNVHAQTYLYKRVMIVKNGNKTSKNDDAHYITFNNKGCYESDQKGFTTNNGFVKFTKNENNLHCYYGNCYFGTAHYYFSNDYSRLNIVLENNTTYVYQKEPSGRTSASLRKNKRNNGNGSGGYVVPPIINTPPAQNPNGGSSGSSSGSHHSLYTRCKYCNGTGVCSSCHGKCGSWEWVYNSKSWIDCGNCRGNGRCPICRGTGRL